MLPVTAPSFAPTITSAIPFVVLLLCIAILPLALPHFWEKNRNKLIVALVLGIPVATYLSYQGAGTAVEHSIEEYVSFIILLGSLYIISGGIVLRGNLRATPRVNSAFLAVGALLASFMGTTGAAMLLIRPLLRTNGERRHVIHTVIFFIFIVANIGGCLTPLGDPPLFLGYLRGVPFYWTFGLWPQWLFMNSILLVIYFLIDSLIYRHEAPEDIKIDDREATKLSLAGKHNLVYLAGIIFSVAFLNDLFIGEAADYGVREIVMVILAVLSLTTTRRKLRKENKFTFEPIKEVAYLFIGIFLTMTPALMYLEAHGADLGISKPWQFFWSTGLLSAFLDNAPTYLTFSSLASSITSTSAINLNELIANAGPISGGMLLKAISIGAVFMGAVTYVGNGPNFMVKAIADESGVRMPSFLAYFAWSSFILLPLFVMVTFIFFR